MKILPCPFCSGDKIELLTDGYTESSADNFWVSCIKCGSWGPWRPTERQATNVWNKASRKVHEN
jgi:hypothetical protein